MHPLNTLTYIWLALLGVSIGSFINVVVYRLPRGNFFSEPRSFCPACRTPLAPRDLVPVFSFVALRGRCRFCREPIPPRYPAVEAASALLCVLCALRFGFAAHAFAVFAACSILLAAALTDLDTMEIPNALIIALIPVALAFLPLFPGVSLLERVIGIFAVSLPMLIAALLIDGAFGGADIKLMAVCGFMLGVKNLLAAFFIAILLGGFYALYLIVRRKTKKGMRIPFAPYLCTGCAISLFYGSELIRAYLNLY